MAEGTSTRKLSPKQIVLIVVAAVASLGLLGAAFVGVAQATDSPKFCESACHEMKPYATAWHQGAHKGVACVECHVEPGLTNRLEHKLVALNELKVHVFGEPTFPIARKLEPIPNERCERCHPNPVVNKPGFSHAQHAGDRACVRCHSTAGHSVSPSALAAAGILNPKAAQARQLQKAAFGQGAADLSNHVSVACSDCHKMSATPCETCHTQPADHKKTSTTACATCHQPGEEFVFSHPTGRNDCESCHTPAENHFKTDATCTSCHTKPGVDWKFAHTTKRVACDTCHQAPAKHRAGECQGCHTKPGVSWAFTHNAAANCSTCHKAPAGHRSGNCVTCHKRVGVTWAFTHPKSSTCTACHPRPAGHRTGSCSTCHRRVGVSWAFTHSGSSSCTTCHRRPAGHRSGSCATCHRRVGVSWLFTHPSSSSCTTCHRRPAGHRSGSCTSCHRVGASWRFVHPTSKSCASCHSAPANHYGTACASCHSPSRAWGNATFNHPSIPGGEHTYRSFACTKCHPSGPPKLYCTCHKGNPPDDD